MKDNQGYRPRLKKGALKSHLHITKEENRILIIGDPHEPFSLDGYIDHCLGAYYNYNCNRVIFIGDIIDNHYSSYHETSADGMGGADELEAAIERIKMWYEVFPDAYVTIGNHDRMVMRKAQTSQIPSRWIKAYKEVLGTPGWEFVERVVFDDVQYIHGEAGNRQDKGRCGHDVHGTGASSHTGIRTMDRRRQIQDIRYAGRLRYRP